ncbi:type II secretion system F family protein [Streptomyces sp. NPDC091272]|uniref:type II secretion system F family protein n=1 Tax=Streptomyces sp. NPDC091272 TaxID=3365981 RepID=UPI0038116114
MSGEVVHRLGAVVAAGAAVGSLAFAVAGRRSEREARQRLVRLLAVEAAVYEEARRGLLRGRVGWARDWGGPAGALVAGYVLVGGVWGCLAGAVAAVGVRRWQRGRQSGGEAAAEEAAVGRQLPLAADLLAACVAAGAGPLEAAGAVGDSLGGPVGERLSRVAAELRLGGEPAQAWGRVAAIPGAAGLARCLERAGTSGAPAAGPIGRVADGLRAERARLAEASANRAGVLIVVPLSLCFLPAFLVVGVAPVVIGLADGLLGGG